MKQEPATGVVLKTLLMCVAAFLILLLLDGLVFRIGPYPKILEPDSSAGEFELVLRREQLAQKDHGDNLVVTVGNSRLAYYPRIAGQIAGSTGYLLRNAGLAGTDARTWYYMLRDLDPTARRYRALVLAVDDYDDEDDYYNPLADLTGIHFIAARLRFADIPEYAASFNTAVRWQIFRASLLKGIAFQSDILAFLSHPWKRLAYVKLADRYYAQWTWDFVDERRNMEGLRIDWATLKVTLPPDAGDAQRSTVNRLARAPAPQTGRLAAFRRQWFGKIMDRYSGSRTKVIFIRLPRGPIPRPDNLARKLSGSIREFASRPNVILASEHAFDSLESPALFKDGQHLNDAGCTQFTILLAREVRRILGAPRNAL